MPVSKEYAACTVCRDHTKINPKELRGSLRWHFYSECDAKRLFRGCKFSHTIFNTKRVLKLAGENEQFIIKLEYGHGFERYGAYDDWASGWNVTVNGRSLRSGGSMEKTYNLTESLLLAEMKLGVKVKGDPDVRYEKTQTLCTAHYENSNCRRTECHFDHDLIDATRIERLVRWPPREMSEYEALMVECRKLPNGRIVWRITLLPDAFAKLSPTDAIAGTIPPRPFNYEDEDLLKVIRRMEAVVGHGR